MAPRTFTRWRTWLFPLLLAACDGSGPVSPPETGVEGAWILDFERTIDDFPFSESACEETFPEGSSAIDTIPDDALAAVRIISTACYHVRVHVENPAGDTVRFFDSRFGIFHRSDEEKNRGVVGFVAWNGKDDSGNRVRDGRYLWRMVFDFGKGRILRFRADIPLP